MRKLPLEWSMTDEQMWIEISKTGCEEGRKAEA